MSEAELKRRVAVGSDTPAGLPDGGFTVAAFAGFPMLMAMQPGMLALGRWITVALSVLEVQLSATAAPARREAATVK